MNSYQEYDLNNIPLIISLIGKNGDLMEYDPKLFSFKLTYEQTYYNSTLRNSYHDTEIIPLNPCDNDTNYNKYKNYFEDNFYSSKQICVSCDGTFVIKGKFGDKNYSSLKFEMNICNENINDCYSKTEIVNKLKESYIIFGYLENIIDNYDYHNPIKLKKKS